MNCFSSNLTKYHMPGRESHVRHDDFSVLKTVGDRLPGYTHGWLIAAMCYPFLHLCRPVQQFILMTGRHHLLYVTRKLCYRKDDRAMRPTHRCPENFRDSLTTPTATIPNIFMGFCSDRPYECSYKI